MRWARAFPALRLNPHTLLLIAGTALSLAVWSAVAWSAVHHFSHQTAATPVETDADLRLTRQFCADVYYPWRSIQAGDRGVPAVDVLCFDAQEMRP